MKKLRAVYSKEFKVSTIRMMESKGMSAKEVEESLGYRLILSANSVAKLQQKGQNHSQVRVE